MLVYPEVALRAHCIHLSTQLSAEQYRASPRTSVTFAMCSSCSWEAGIGL